MNLFTRAELEEILKKSRKNNTQMGITGILLYKEGNLMQALEGERSAVYSLYSKIARDPRHKGLIKIMEGPLEKRQFADWSMAYIDLNSDESNKVEGYSDFLNSPIIAQECVDYPNSCQKLLHMFKKNNR